MQVVEPGAGANSPVAKTTSAAMGAVTAAVGKGAGFTQSVAATATDSAQAGATKATSAFAAAASAGASALPTTKTSPGQVDATRTNSGRGFLCCFAPTVKE